MQKCPLCDKKIPQDAKFCPLCGWDLTDHELTPLQIARVQEGIQDVRSKAMHLSIGVIAFAMLALAYMMLRWFAMAEVIPERWGFFSITGLVLLFLFVGIALNFFSYRYQKRQDRLKTMLRDRQSSQ
jgi:hypothetical protein